MIPDKNSSKWRDLVTGRRHLDTDHFGLQLFLKRVSTKLKPTSPADEIDAAVIELHAFFVKYERILQKELANILK
jgi:hypothetical protein